MLIVYIFTANYGRVWSAVSPQGSALLENRCEAFMMSLLKGHVALKKFYNVNKSCVHLVL